MYRVTTTFINSLIRYSSPKSFVMESKRLQIQRDGKLIDFRGFPVRNIEIKHEAAALKYGTVRTLVNEIKYESPGFQGNLT